MNSVQELVFYISIHVYVFITGISLFFEKQQIFMKIQLGVKTNGNFGGFPVGNDILSNFGISLGNPHMCAICKTYILYAGSRYCRRCCCRRIAIMQSSF